METRGRSERQIHGRSDHQIHGRGGGGKDGFLGDLRQISQKRTILRPSRPWRPMVGLSARSMVGLTTRAVSKGSRNWPILSTLKGPEN